MSQLAKTNIPYADFGWSPTSGCSKGCEWCYARKRAQRFCTGKLYRGFVKGCDGQCHLCADVRAQFHEASTPTLAVADEGENWPVGFHPTVYPHRLDAPLCKKKPSVIFCGHMGDLFDPAIPSSFIGRVFGHMAASPWHRYLVLTKQPQAMSDLLTDYATGPLKGEAAQTAWELLSATTHAGQYDGLSWPLPNVWLGVTVTNQAEADERIPILRDTPAAHRWVSYEPALGPVDFRQMGALGDRCQSEACRTVCEYQRGCRRLSWVVAGPLTGPGSDSAPCNAPGHSDSWIRLAHEDCKAAGVPFFDKREPGLSRELPWRLEAR